MPCCKPIIIASVFMGLLLSKELDCARRPQALLEKPRWPVNMHNES